MAEFRSIHPKRQNITTKVSTYNAHKESLRKDFNERCGYCNCFDHFKKTFYEIDHFIPVNILTIMSATDYANLVYACRSCNNAKSCKWPSNDESIPHFNNEGFIDPCDENYAVQFTRNDNGEIVPITELGKWMYRELKLYNFQHAIIWKLEQLYFQIKEIKELIKEDENHPLNKLMDQLCRQYFDFDTQLREY